jgi:hypothetical protein
MSPDPDQPDAVNEEDDGRVELRFATFDQIAMEVWRRSRSSVLAYVGSPDDEPSDDDPDPVIYHHGSKADRFWIVRRARQEITQEAD